MAEDARRLHGHSGAQAQTEEKLGWMILPQETILPGLHPPTYEEVLTKMKQLLETGNRARSPDSHTTECRLSDEMRVHTRSEVPYAIIPRSCSPLLGPPSVFWIVGSFDYTETTRRLHGDYTEICNPNPNPNQEVEEMSMREC